jgi:hypothetical protein
VSHINYGSILADSGTNKHALSFARILRKQAFKNVWRNFAYL